MTKFAIVITTYKRSDGSTPFYLKRALSSILNQDYDQYKIFVNGDKNEEKEKFEG
jgi:glycosyltransferase involved in cell wall biosynthesis